MDPVERHELRIDALRRGHNQWGHGGTHRGTGAPDCPREWHHHHDAFCALPSPLELAEAGVTEPEHGWRSRRG